MARRKKSVDKDQMILDLFADMVENLSLQGGSQEHLSDFEFRFRRELKAAIDAAGMDRYEIAARMSRLLGREITKSHIDQWTALSTVQRRIHADSLKALCEITDNWSALQLLVESCGFRMLTQDEAVYAQYGAKMMLKKMIDSEIKDTLSGMDEAALRSALMKRMKGGKA